MAWDALNLEKQLTFYGAYHHNPVNVKIHIVCVPLIMLTYFLLGTNTANLLPQPIASFFPSSLPPNLGTISTLIWLTFFSLLDLPAAILVSPLLLTATAYSAHLTTTIPSTANTAATLIFIGSWIAQFIGHGVYEGRAPALLDNLVQAVFLAPCFVWLEVLFAFGYRRELQARVGRAVEVEIEKFRLEKARKGGKEVNGQVYGTVEEVAEKVGVDGK